MEVVPRHTPGLDALSSSPLELLPLQVLLPLRPFLGLSSCCPLQFQALLLQVLPFPSPASFVVVVLAAAFSEFPVLLGSRANFSSSR